MQTKHSIYESGLEVTAANYAALTPLSFAERTAAIYPELTAVVYGDLRRTWGETYERMCRMASALAGRTQTRENTKNHARPHTAPSRGIP